MASSGREACEIPHQRFGRFAAGADRRPAADYAPQYGRALVGQDIALNARGVEPDDLADRRGHGHQKYTCRLSALRRGGMFVSTSR